MGYTDAQGRPEIKPGAWFGVSPVRMRRSTTTGSVAALKPGAVAGTLPQQGDESATADPRVRVSARDRSSGVTGTAG